MQPDMNQEDYVSSIRRGEIKPERAGRYWTDDEREQLKELYQMGKSITELMIHFRRYEGEFKDGAPNGQGNRFSCSLYYSVLASQMSGADSLRLDDIGFTVTVGKFRDGSANGQVKQYRSGMLSYEGEMKNDSGGPEP